MVSTGETLIRDLQILIKLLKIDEVMISYKAKELSTQLVVLFSESETQIYALYAIIEILKKNMYPDILEILDRENIWINALSFSETPKGLQCLALLAEEFSRQEKIELYLSNMVHFCISVLMIDNEYSISSGFNALNFLTMRGLDVMQHIDINIIKNRIFELISNSEYPLYDMFKFIDTTDESLLESLRADGLINALVGCLSPKNERASSIIEFFRVSDVFPSQEKQIFLLTLELLRDGNYPTKVSVINYLEYFFLISDNNIIMDYIDNGILTEIAEIVDTNSSSIIYSIANIAEKCYTCLLESGLDLYEVAGAPELYEKLIESEDNLAVERAINIFELQEA